MSFENASHFAENAKTTDLLRSFFAVQTSADSAIQAKPLHSEQDRLKALYAFLRGVDFSDEALENIGQQQFKEALSTVKFKRRKPEAHDAVLADMEQQGNWARRLTQQVLKLI